MSSELAIQYHSITIGDKNTWDDWHLVPTSRPLVNPPSIKTRYVDIPGKHGSLDLTNIITGRPIYQNRTGSWEFYVINVGQIFPNYNRKFKYSIGDYCIRNNRLYQCVVRISIPEPWTSSHWTQVYADSNGLWQTRYTAIMTYLHGKELQMILDDDPDYYYVGRFSVNEWASDPGNSTIVIDYNVGPYKNQLYGMNENWLWDPFFFGDNSNPQGDTIRTYKNLSLNGTLTVKFLAVGPTTNITITCTNTGVTMVCEGETYTLSKGDNELDTLYLEEGEHTMTFTGSGKVSINAVGGLL